MVFTFCNYGKHGVQLFFFLSAYTLCLSRQDRANEVYANKKYFIRRFFRIAPLYYFGIALYGTVYLLKSHTFLQWFNVNTEYSSYILVRHLTFTQSFSSDVIFGGVPGGWSIGTEMLFYIIFPFLYDKMYLIKSKYRLILLPIFVAISSFVFFRALPHLFPPLSKHDFNFYYCTFINQVSIFLLGISFFILYKDKSFSKANGYICLILFALSSSVLLFFKHIGFQDISLFPFFTGCSFIFLFIAFRSLDFLNIKFIQWVGRVSFSMYLFHFLFAWGLSSQLNSILIINLNSYLILSISIMLTVLCSLLVATLTKYMIEDKGIELGFKIIKHKLNFI